MKVYKIRDLRTGKFQNGGGYLCWSEFGKSWNSMRSIKAHITHMTKYSLGPAGYGKIDQTELSFWEVVEFELQETDCQPASIYLKKKK